MLYYATISERGWGERKGVFKKTIHQLSHPPLFKNLGDSEAFEEGTTVGLFR